ncbi:MAG: zf-HC2 domain-containing protein [Gemmatimonadota bacterium]|nr:zf-HC2 domain-containing protein [Gemmatimonadota bacterium]
MQHLDEGTIHSWLDGALSADDAARVEAHAAECPQCAAAVAEARGFIAASSRILTALDHVPRGVVPAARVVKWHNRAVWRAAAAVLVVAVGSLVVVRNTEFTTSAASSVATDSARASAITPTTEAQIAPSSEKAATSKVQTIAPPTASTPSATPSRPTFSGKAARNTAQSSAPARDQELREGIAGAVASDNVAPPQVAATSPPASQSFAPPIILRGPSTYDGARDQPPLKVVGTPNMIGARVTLYEVAPGDTVTLTEPAEVQLQSSVVTAAGAVEPMARRSVAKSGVAAPTARADTVIASAADSQRSAKEMKRVATQSAATPVLRTDVANEVTMITWRDPNSGNTLTLSGRIPRERLEVIKRRIEQDRAAAAAKKTR